MSQPTSQILNDLQAENVLNGSSILEQIDGLRNGLRYSTGSAEISFDDFFGQMQKEVDDVSTLQLESSLSPGTETQYQIQLVTALEKVFDEADAVANRLLFFQSKIKAAVTNAKQLETVFVAYYTIAATEMLEGTKTRLPAATIKALAEGEFARLFQNVNIDLETLLEATKVLAKQIQSHKSLAQEKYNLGKDQVNASWTSQNLPAEGLESSSGASNLLSKAEPEEEDTEAIPAFVSQKPTIDRQIEIAVATAPPSTQNRLGKDGLIWPYCDMCHDPKCPWCYQENWQKKEPTVAELPHVEDIAEAVDIVSKGGGPVVIEGAASKTIIGLPQTAHFPDDDTEDILPITVTVTPADGSVLPGTVNPFEEQPVYEVVFAPKVPPGTPVERVKEGQEEKIKCKNCDKRIRIGQMMVSSEGKWFHSNAADCTAPAKKAKKLDATEVIEHIAPDAVKAPTTEIKGTFKKTGDPHPVQMMGQTDVIDAGTLLQFIEKTAQETTPPPRKKLEMLPEDEVI